MLPVVLRRSYSVRTPYPSPRLNDRRAADVVHSIRVKIAAKAGHELSKAPYLPVTNRSAIAHNPQLIG